MFDLMLAGAILLGFVAGWAGAAAALTSADNAARRMWSQFKASILASGIGLLIVLWAVRLFNLDPLGAATVAAGMGVLGVNGIEIFRNGMRNWLRSFVNTATDALGDQRQSEAKQNAAAHIIESIQTPDDAQRVKERLAEAEKRRSEDT